MPEIAFLNGEFLPVSEAKVSVDDRGYQFGDAVYEVVCSYAGRLWALERHLLRLDRSLSELRIHGISIDEVRQRIIEAYEKSGIADAAVYIQISRGVAPRSHTYSDDMKPTFLITVREITAIPDEILQNGARAITVADFRWGRVDIKTTNLLGNIMAKQQAKECCAFEAILVNKDGNVTEGAATNVFIVSSGKLLTAEEGHHILSGITRGVVIECARDLGIDVQEGPVTKETMMSADEVFLSGTTSEVLGIVEIDGKQIGAGGIGPITQKLREAFLDRVEKQLDAP